MYVVRKDVNGQIEWDEKLEVKSLQEFTLSFKKRLSELGLHNETVSVVSETSVEHRNGQGRIVETFHLCQESGSKLL